MLGEGKAQNALGWVLPGPCPHPHSHVETEAPSEVLRIVRFRPMALILRLHSPPENRDPLPGTRKEVGLEVRVVRSPAVMDCDSVPQTYHILLALPLRVPGSRLFHPTSPLNGPRCPLLREGFPSLDIWSTPVPPSPGTTLGQGHALLVSFCFS